MQRRDTALVLKEFVPKMKWRDERSETILDIGCGSGDVTSALLAPMMPEQSRIVGVDVSEAMVKYATKTFGSQNIAFETLVRNVGHLIVTPQKNKSKPNEFTFQKPGILKLIIYHNFLLPGHWGPSETRN